MGTFPIESCERCGAMLHVKDADLHKAWHRKVERYPAPEPPAVHFDPEWQMAP